MLQECGNRECVVYYIVTGACTITCPLEGIFSVFVQGCGIVLSFRCWLQEKMRSLTCRRSRSRRNMMRTVVFFRTVSFRFCSVIGEVVYVGSFDCCCAWQ